MWWGIAVALVLLIPLMAFYVFVAVRLRTVRRSAPSAAAGDVLSSVARSSVANAIQKLAIILILFFVALRDDPAGFHLVWMSLIVLLPPIYSIMEAARRGKMEARLDSDSRQFLKTLDQVPMLPWQSPMVGSRPVGDKPGLD